MKLGCVWYFFTVSVSQQLVWNLELLPLGDNTQVQIFPCGETLWLLLLLSRFSRVWLCATPETAAHQAPLSLGFSRQEHWSELPFPPPMHESKKWQGSRAVVSNSSRPHGLQPSWLLRHGIFQARVLEWGAIAFSRRASISQLFDVHCLFNSLYSSFLVL